MTPSHATLQVDTPTTEDRSVLERVLGRSLDGLKLIEVQHLAGAVKYRLGAGVKQSVGCRISGRHQECVKRHEDLREALRKMQFLPFKLHLPEGRTVSVTHHDFALLAPNGRLLTISEI